VPIWAVVRSIQSRRAPNWTFRQEKCDSPQTGLIVNRDSADFASIGMTITGMPELPAIGPVGAAPAGMLTDAGLPLQASVGRFGP
jgi:hypothetical protein